MSQLGVTLMVVAKHFYAEGVAFKADAMIKKCNHKHDDGDDDVHGSAAA